MTNEGHKLATQLAKLASELKKIADELLAQPATQRPAVSLQRERDYQCLQCGKDLHKETRVRRGVCSACYQKSLRRVGEAGFDWLVQNGAMLPPGPTGRPSKETFLDQLLREQSPVDTEAVADELTQAHDQLEPPAKKPRRKRRDKRRDNHN